MATRNVLIVVLAATTIGSLGWNLYRFTHADDLASVPGRSPAARATGAPPGGAGGAAIAVRLGVVAN
ncbi:MAG: hypothetical protein ABIT36_09490, partial [Steroidobacteraceae bacterium]